MFRGNLMKMVKVIKKIIKYILQILTYAIVDVSLQ